MKKKIHVTFIPRRFLRHSRSKIVPSVNSEQKHEDINTRVLSPTCLSVMSTPTLQFQSTARLTRHVMSNKTNNSKRSLLTSSFSMDVIERSLKKTYPDLRKQTIDKKKQSPKRRRIAIIILVILFILAAIAVGIYLIIRFTTQSTSTTKAMTALLRWNSTGQTVAGIGGSFGVASDKLYLPADLAIDSAYTLYIADFNNNRIQKWLYGASTGTTVAGQSDGSTGSNTTHLRGPCGINIDSNSNLYVADTNNNRIQFWAKDALSASTIAGTGNVGSSNSDLHSPYDVVYDETTRIIYITDTYNHRIMIYTSGASVGSIVAGGNGQGTNQTQLYLPLRFVFDSVTNSFIIANFGANNIVRWVLGDTSWTLIAGAINGSSGNSSTLLNSPTGVTLDPMGNIYVTDSINSRIQMFASGQSIGTTIAGISGVPGSNATQLNSPFSVTFDNQLNLYVVDTANHRIQKFIRY